MTIDYVKESDNMEKDPLTTKKFRENNSNTTPRTSINTVEEFMEISHDKLPQMPEKSIFMFHHNFYPRPKVDLEDGDIIQETKNY